MTKKPSQHEINAFVLRAYDGENAAVIEFLDKYGDDAIDAKDSSDWKALMGAAINNLGNTKATIELLLERGADINKTGTERNTPLMFAANNGNEEIVELLLENGADIDAEDIEGKTASMRAQKNGWTETVFLMGKWQEKRKAQELAAEIADFSPALKRDIPATRPPGIRRPRL